MNNMRRLVILPIAMLVLAACQGGGQSSAPAAEESEPPATESPAASEPATSVGAAAGVPCDEASGDDALARVCEAGVLVISTDPAYPPQSSLNTETGEYEGFDIGGCLERSQLSANIRTGTRDVDGSMYSPFDFDTVTIERYSFASRIVAKPRFSASVRSGLR